MTLFAPAPALPVAALVFALGASAHAVELKSDCNEVAVPGSLTGETFYRCRDGNNYRRFDGSLEQVNRQGRLIADEVVEESGSAPIEAPNDAPLATPEFQPVPGGQVSSNADVADSNEASNEAPTAADEPVGPVFQQAPRQ